MPIFDASALSWDGAEGKQGSSKLQLDRKVWRGAYPVLRFPALSSTDQVLSETKAVGLRLIKPFSPIGRARVTKIHGPASNPARALYGGVSKSHLGTLCEGQQSECARDPIPTHFKPDQEMEMGFNKTLNEFQYLYLQYSVNSGLLDSYNKQSESDIGHTLIQVAFEYDPGIEGRSLTFDETKTLVFVVDENDEMQCVGNFFNDKATDPVSLKKLFKGSQPYKLTTEMNLSFMGSNIFWDMMPKRKNKNCLDPNLCGFMKRWETVVAKEILFVTYSNEGRECIVSLIDPDIEVYKGIQFGRDNNKMPFRVSGSNSSFYISHNAFDCHYFAVAINEKE